MQAQMKNPGVVIPDAMTAVRALTEAIKQGGVPPRTLDLVHLRASQINGCSVCVGAARRPATTTSQPWPHWFSGLPW